MSIDFASIPTPSYLVDERLLIKNLEKLKKVEKEAGIEIILAFKAFSLWRLFPLVKKYFTKAAASGEYEARLAFEELGKPAHTYCPAFSENNFDQVLQYSSHITFNSLNQYDKFSSYLNDQNPNISAGLRVNPGYSEVEVDLYNPALPGSRLGIGMDELENGLPGGIKGFHFHNLCESTSFALEKTLQAFEKNFGRFLPSLEWVNMGGGHLITSKEYDIDHLISLLTNFKKKYNVKVILEPGSAFAWETGCLVSEILDIVERNGIRTAMLDVSFTAHMPDCLEMPYKPRIVGAVSPGKGSHKYRMGGVSCLAGDYMGDWFFNKELKVGDKIIFEDMIHYTIVKTTMFNGVSHPRIGLWKDGQYHLLRDFNYFDYKNRMD